MTTWRCVVLWLAILAGLFAGPARASADPVDWGVRVVDTTMQRFPSAATWPWRYARALYLHGQLLLYRRTGDARYLDYIRRWGEAHVRSDGTVVEGDGTPVVFSSLDSLMPGGLLARLHEVTGGERYRLAARRMRAELDSWPRTTNGGFWHARRATGQLWADGAFMSTFFLLAYERAFDDAGRSREEAVRQLLAYAAHLQDPDSGLLRHAYSAPRTAPWASPVTGRSPEVWCRAVGWYGMALVDTLADLPKQHARRPELIAILKRLVLGLERHQDPPSWRWFQVVDRGGDPANWVETSCSAMHAYTISRAVERGWLGLGHQGPASQAYQGVLEAASIDQDGLARIDGIVVGTSVGDLAYYLARPRPRDDFHGLGAFLIMQDQLARLPAWAGRHRIEAEDGTLAAPLAAHPQAGASGGAVVARLAGASSVGAPGAGRATYRLNLAKPGRYKLWGRFTATSEVANSFWVRIDNGPWRLWSVVPHAEAYWAPLRTGRGVLALPVLLELAEGPHLLELAGAEAGTRLDVLLLTAARHYVPAGPGG